MQLKQITLAVAALATAPAFALTPGDVDSSTVRLWLSGASAPTTSVYKGVLTLCSGMEYKDAQGNDHVNPGSRDAHLYLESSSAGKLPGGAGDRMAYTCTVGTDDLRAGSLEGQKMVVFHTVEGGSFNYVTPHISILGEANPNLPGKLDRIANIETLATAGKCANGAAETVTVDISGKGNDVGVYRGCSKVTQNFTAGQALRANVTDAPDRPEGGFSDTEYLINKLNLDVVTDLGDIGSEVPTNIGQAFGVAVSYPLYAQLQKNDGLINTVANDGEACDGVYTTLACQPGITAQEYSTVANQAAAGSIDASLFGGAATGKVNFARRAITSGTQSASNLRFLNKPCATGDAGGVLEPARVADSTTTFVVTEQSGTGGVKTALNAATGAGEFGLGIMSLENIPAPTATADRWAFVKLNTVSPNLADSFQRAEAIKGNYDFWYELMAFTAATAPQAGIDLLAAINASLANPELTNLRGLFLTPLAGVTGSNVAKGARFGNSCQVIGQ